MLNPDDKKNLSKVRLEHAFECLNTARIIVEANDYKSAANRSYYAVFHAMRAVLALDGIDMKKHSAVIAEFRRLYIKTNKLNNELSNTITCLFDMRNDSDYDDFYSISKEDVMEQIESATLFLNEIKLFLKSQGII